jgi:hypothetical protein
VAVEQRETRVVGGEVDSASWYPPTITTSLALPRWLSGGLRQLERMTHGRIVSFAQKWIPSV